MKYLVAGLVGIVAIASDMKLAIARPTSANPYAVDSQVESVYERNREQTAELQREYQSENQLEHQPEQTARSPQSTSAEQLNLDPSILENSPTLQRWLGGTPDVLEEIRTDPSFRTRVRVGYSHYPSQEGQSGISLGIEDVFIGRSNVTLSGEYQSNFTGDRQRYGADLRYYALPLGSYVNVAPVVGYRHIEIADEAIDGANLGLRVLLSLSRTGASDIALSQTWVSPGTSDETGITTLSVGYALTQQLRISTDLQRQNAPKAKDDRVGINLEWML